MSEWLSPDRTLFLEVRAAIVSSRLVVLKVRWIIYSFTEIWQEGKVEGKVEVEVKVEVKVEVNLLNQWNYATYKC